MYNYKVTQIEFNDNTKLIPSNLTVIVGPNNAGKSRALKDIAVQTTRYSNMSSIIVKRVEWTLPQNLQELREAYNVERFQDENGNWAFRTLTTDLINEKHHASGTVWPDWFEGQINRPEKDNLSFFADYFGWAMVAYLTTEHRLQLVRESHSPSHAEEAANLLQVLFNEGKTTEEFIRRVVKRAFGREIALDFTVLQKLLLRVGDDFSMLPPDHRDAKPILMKQEKLDEQGDGIRSFVGVILAMLCVKRSLFLIDEPEAFLHPPQAFRIGEFLAEQANHTRQVILATHSTDVLRGILSKTQDVTIVRIDRVGNTNSFKLLNPDRLKELVIDPLLSSARVLDGLFYSGVVVVEADSDARFYQVVSNKWSTDVDLHFVNADNKQTVPRITKLYQDMGVRCAGIVDFDVLNNTAEFKKQLETLEFNKEEIDDALMVQGEIARAAKDIPPEERLENAKQQIHSLLDSINNAQSRAYSSDKEQRTVTEQLLRQIEIESRKLADSTKGWKQFKQSGRVALPPEIQSKFDQLWEMCAIKGLFINPCGELESMLTAYGIPATTDKRSWITQALQLLPDLKVNDEKYPWKFIKAIHNRIVGI